MDLEFPDELAPVSFACLSVHILITAENSELTWLEIVHFWSHAMCSTLVAQMSVDKSKRFHLLLLLLLVLWPFGYLLLKRLRMLLAHPSRSSLPNVAERSGSVGSLLLLFSLYLACQSASCLVYGSEAEPGRHVAEWSYCRENNRSIHQMNYYLSKSFIVYSLFKHLSGTVAHQVMLFRLKLYEGLAVIFSLISGLYCLYEYSSEPGGTPFAGNAGMKEASSILVWLFFLTSVLLLAWCTPEVYIPFVLHSSSKGSSPFDESFSVDHDRVVGDNAIEVVPEKLKETDNEDSERVLDELKWMRNTFDSEFYVMRALYLGQESKRLSSFQQALSPGHEEECMNDDHIHPLVQYYNEHYRMPPITLLLIYLREIVFFWRLSLFVLTVGYKLLVFISSRSAGYRYWAQILNPLSTSALIVHWMLALRCDYRDRVSNQALNFHFWFHALSEIPSVIVWIRDGYVEKAVFNIIVMVIIWPLVFIGCKRIIYTLQSRSLFSLLSTSTQFFIEGMFFMAIEFYLAFQAHSCILAASSRSLGLDHCTALLHANQWSGMNIAMTFLVVRVLIFVLGGLSLPRLLHLQLRLYEVVALSLCTLSGSVTLYFFANKDVETARPGTVIKGIETTSMIGYISVFLLMSYKHWEEETVKSGGYTGIGKVEKPFNNNNLPYSAADEEGEDNVLQHGQDLHEKDSDALAPNGPVYRNAASYSRRNTNHLLLDQSLITMPQRGKSGCNFCTSRCACWTKFSLWMDYRDSGSNIPVFRLILCSGTVIFIVLVAWTVVGRVDRYYATSMEGLSLACVCCHWLITIEQSTATVEVVHLLGHACAEFALTFLWVYDDERLEAIYTVLSILVVYPCLYHGVRALKLGMQRKFDKETLQYLAIAIAKKSFILLFLLLYLFFESFGCVHIKSADYCRAILYTNKQIGLSSALAFLVYLSLVVLQGVDTRRVLYMNLSNAQLLVFGASTLAVVLCMFSLASRHNHEWQYDIVDCMVEILTLICWYVALGILWVRRPWYDIRHTRDDDPNGLEDHLAMVPISPC